MNVAAPQGHESCTSQGEDERRDAGDVLPAVNDADHLDHGAHREPQPAAALRVLAKPAAPELTMRHPLLRSGARVSVPLQEIKSMVYAGINRCATPGAAPFVRPACRHWSHWVRRERSSCGTRTAALHSNTERQGECMHR